jgi:hypothetical protein
LLPVIHHLGVLVASSHQEHKTNHSLTGRNTKSKTDSVNLSNAVEETERMNHLFSLGDIIVADISLCCWLKTSLYHLTSLLF